MAAVWVQHQGAASNQITTRILFLPADFKVRIILILIQYFLVTVEVKQSFKLVFAF